MGASFRNGGEILELCGCDLLTIAPKLLKELQEATGVVEKKLDTEKAKKLSIERLSIDEKSFRWHVNENAMATEKLSEGIRKFAEATRDLEKTIQFTGKVPVDEAAEKTLGSNYHVYIEDGVAYDWNKASRIGRVKKERV
jgi:hypothetical protein